MNDRQFDPLDDRFRQAAEQFDPPYDPQDWVDMEKLLDGKKDKRKLFPFWWISDLMMMTMLAFFLLQGNKAKETVANKVGSGIELTEKNTVQPNDAGKEVPDKDKAGKNTALVNGENSRPFSQNTGKMDQIGLQGTDLGGQKAGIGFKKEKKLKINEGNPGQKTENSNQALLQSGDNSKLPPENGNANDAAFNQAAGIAASGAGATLPVNSTGLNEEGSQKSAEATGVNPKISNDTSKSTPDSLLVAQSGKDSAGVKKINDPNPSKKGQFFISAIYGQEKSGVKGSSLGPSGSIYGAMAGYQFHENWRVKAGFLVTDKNYSGGSGIYKVPPGLYYKEITDFRAICEIIEIPLLFSYRFLHGKKSNWLVSAGPVTSIMKSEEYHYHYLNNSGGVGYGKKYYNTNEVDWFSGFRISPSYERFFGNKFSLSAEPFIQLPLAGIGEGSVKLHSLGFQITTSILLGPFNKK